jgi:hypothetical protein
MCPVEQRSRVADRVRLGGWFAIALVAVAGCCPPPEPDEPIGPLPPAPPSTPHARTMKPALLSRFERPDAGGVPLHREEPQREMIKEPPLVPPAGPKAEPDLTRRETLAPPERVPARDRLPDDVVIKLLETGRVAFVRCFKKAVQSDPTVISFKVRVHVELDGDGAIASANADTTDAQLAGCLVRSLGWLRFPTTGRPVAVDLPLIYRAE